ncbi:TPA: hypothetical protein DCL30_04325 [Candidatus Peribacteria bacterium]|nr:MAG: hypothetical protein A3J91_02305 [Candidatus Peribacteria bacterium RIFOXYC2_FULL_58_10]OGJ84005.1 MAG: hypothetical protein A2529_04380 [Candidatus Peribacteria bacterium RIFOXYD2_FULL_58_15]HAI98732.1 hypothetical protein [Candidatus Peribacteria bacterium]HAS34148.1 hypothetical protein [Candidatus Peribacteria bacterium]
MKSPTHSPLRYGLLAVALLAVVAVELQVLSRPAIPRLPGTSSLLGQVFTPVNVFTKAQSEEGIVLKKDEHNIFKCPSGDPFSFFATGSLLANDQVTRFWSYEYKGGEPPFLGRFQISQGEYAVNVPDTQDAYNLLLERNGTITEFLGGTTYYVMTEKDLSFKCSTGLDVGPGCGNSRVDPGEQCDAGPANGTEGNDCSAECQFVPYTITLTGRVVDQMTQQGLSGATLQSSYEYGPSTVVTDANGNFSMSISTDFKLTEPGSQFGVPNISGSWSFFKDCYNYGSFSVQRNSSGPLELTKYPFDAAEEIRVPLGSLREVDIGDVQMYPTADISTVTDIPSSMWVWYTYKNREGRNGPGQDGFKTEHFLSNALPLDYDAQVEFIDEQTQKVTSSTFHVPADALCQTVNLRLVGGESQWSICGNGVQEGAEQCDNGTLNGTEGNHCMVSCQLIQTIQIEGRLIDGLTQQPIAGATLASVFAFTPEEVITGPDGQFSFSVKTDFRFKYEGASSSNGGSWVFNNDCSTASIEIFHNDWSHPLQIILRPFDAEKVFLPVSPSPSQTINIGDVAVTPVAHLTVKADVPMTMMVITPFKNIEGDFIGGSAQPVLSFLYRSYLPLDYDTHVQFTDAAGQTSDSTTYHVPTDAMCKTVHLSYVDGQSLWSICGNGVKDGGEECEADSDCTGASSCKYCSCSLCGNGSLDADEECDDANVNSDDGCDWVCQLEPGFACASPGQPCEPVLPTLPGACIVEGASGPVIQNAPQCCVGLTQISRAIPGGGDQCIMMMGSFTCTKCGDGLCGAGENHCNCEVDCPSECLAEGETGSPVMNSSPCCEGLKAVPTSVPGDGGTCSVSILEQFVCTLCGNGECGTGENRCNCVEDCPSQPCANEGETVYGSPVFGPTECCSQNAGIKPRAVLAGGMCVAPSDGSLGTCVDGWGTTCGNGQCGDGEDKCNCSKDCNPAPDIQATFENTLQFSSGSDSQTASFRLKLLVSNLSSSVEAKWVQAAIYGDTNPATSESPLPPGITFLEDATEPCGVDEVGDGRVLCPPGVASDSVGFTIPPNDSREFDLAFVANRTQFCAANNSRVLNGYAYPYFSSEEANSQNNLAIFSLAPLCTPCGNGILDPEEECDDANNIDSDSCSSFCKITYISPALFIDETSIGAGTISVSPGQTDVPLLRFTVTAEQESRLRWIAIQSTTDILPLSNASIWRDTDNDNVVDQKMVGYFQKDQLQPSATLGVENDTQYNISPERTATYEIRGDIAPGAQGSFSIRLQNDGAFSLPINVIWKFPEQDPSYALLGGVSFDGGTCIKVTPNDPHTSPPYYKNCDIEVTTVPSPTWMISASSSSSLSSSSVSSSSSADTSLTWNVADAGFGGSSIKGILYTWSKYWAVGEAGKLATSTNGASWSPIQNTGFGSTDTIYGIGYNGSALVTVGTNGKIFWSSNGTTWTAADLTNAVFGTNTIRTVDYVGSSTFIAAGDGGKAAKSTDNGHTWTYVNMGVGNNAIKAMSRGTVNGVSRLVAVGGGGLGSWSDNGTDWHAFVVSPYGYNFNSIDYGSVNGQGKFVVGTDGGQALTSTDGITWQVTAATWIMPEPINAIEFINAKVLAVGGAGKGSTTVESYEWEPLGSTWKTMNMNFGTDAINAVVYGGPWGGVQRYVAVGDNGKVVYSGLPIIGSSS